MHIEQKQNRIYKPQSVYTYAAEECNQVSTELDNLITDGGLTPSAGDLTQVKKAVNNIVDTAANNLQEQIDAITSASDVFDVVGTYAQLQAYDKSTVPLNDIIKVLQDSTHNNAAAYYRLVETSGATEWQYIGQEGPYYTKSEIDIDFALKSELPSIATVSQVGTVKPDNQTTFVANDGTLSISGNVAAALPLFTPIWADYLLNDASYLRADTFSWQSGAVYTEGYNHLVADISGITAQTETIGSYTITYYQANDGHKIVLADQETTVQNIYNATGVAWYYILDTANTQFKLPRINSDKKEQLLKLYVKGNGKTLGLTDGTNNAGIGGFTAYSFNNTSIAPRLADYDKNTGSSVGANTGLNVSKTFGVTTDQTKSGIIADIGDADTIFSGNKYLYFYVGNFSQSATEQTAGLNSELFNSKADIDLDNLSVASIFNVLKPTNTSMILSATGEICTLGTRKYYKSNTGNCFVGLYTTNTGYASPILVGTTAASVTGYDDYDSTARYTGSLTWNGRTFYYMAFGNTQMPVSSSNLKTINLTHIGNTFAATGEGYLLAAQTLLEIYYNSAKYCIPMYVYNDGKSFCRVYADGWCEQGGFATGTPNVNITFLQPFLNTDYIFNSTIRNGQGDGTVRILVPIIGTNTTTGITLQSSPSYSGTQAYWEAKGYVF